MLSAIKVLKATPLLAVRASCGLTRNADKYQAGCPRCTGLSRPIDGRPSNMIDVDGTTLDVESSFFYLGEMLSASGGCDSAIDARCSSAWCRIRIILTMLTSQHISLRIRGKKVFF